jgi:hypothetical protein
MTLSELIVELQALEAVHGDVDVCVDQYNGGNDIACDVREVLYDSHPHLIMLVTGQRSWGFR